VVAPPVPGPEDGTTVWQHLVATLGPGRAPAGREPIGVPEAWRAAARRAVAGIGVPAGARWLLVHPGAGGAWKLGPPATLARIVREAAAGTDVWPIVHEGPADRQTADATAALIEPSPGRLVEPPLPVLAAVLSMSAGYLGGDSGVSHLAAAVGARAVLLYPAATRGRWAPWSPTARVLGLADADLTERAASALRESIGGEGSGETGA
jgi:ADP-heptose:LPS heptosyltransferase